MEPGTSALVSRSSGWRPAQECATAVLLLLTVGLLLFPSSGRDDAHITYWEAHALQQYWRILNYNGAMLEQSSSLLHVVIVAIGEWALPLGAVTVGKLSSILFGGLTVVLTHRLGAAVDRRAAFAAALAVAATPYLAYWSFGGLETTLASALTVALPLGALGYLSKGGIWRLGLTVAIAGLFVLVRPENSLVALLALSCFVPLALPGLARAVGVPEVSVRRLAALWLSTAILASVCVACRQAVFGLSFPQPVYAKAAGMHLYIRGGLEYLSGQLLRGNSGMLLFAIATVGSFVVLVAVRRHRMSLPAFGTMAFLVSILMFVVATGGDWMEAGRFLVPTLPLAAVCIATATMTMGGRRAALILAVLIATCIWGSVTLASHDSTGMPLWSSADSVPESTQAAYSWFERHNRVNLRDMPTIQRMDELVGQMAGALGRPVHVMTAQMGMVAFHVTQRHYGQVEWVDRFGLSDASFTRCELARSLPHRRSGLGVPYSFYFEHQAELEKGCGISPPDLILELAPADRASVSAHHYTIVFEQGGAVSGSGRLTGDVVNGAQFIAVRDDLLTVIGFHTPADAFRFDTHRGTR